MKMHWNRLSREMVESPSLKLFKKNFRDFLGTWLIGIVN